MHSRLQQQPAAAAGGGVGRAGRLPSISGDARQADGHGLRARGGLYAAIQLNDARPARATRNGLRSVKQKRPTKRGFVAGQGLGLPPPSLREAQPGPTDRRAGESLLRRSLRACDTAVTAVPFLTPAQPSDELLPGPPRGV